MIMLNASSNGLHKRYDEMMVKKKWQRNKIDKLVQIEVGQSEHKTTN